MEKGKEGGQDRAVGRSPLRAAYSTPVHQPTGTYSEYNNANSKSGQSFDARSCSCRRAFPTLMCLSLWRQNSSSKFKYSQPLPYPVELALVKAFSLNS
jgi:hypothetical protein